MSRLGRWTRILTLHCETATELASQDMDEPLGVADRLALRAHVLICRSCRRFNRQVRRIRVAARALDHDRAASAEHATLSTEARRRIAQALHEEETGDGPPS